jgi:hypothetical protein
MATFASATFTGTNWQDLIYTTPVQGGPWVKHPNEAGNWYLYGNRALCRSGGLNYLSGTPSSADYSVSATIHIKSSVGSTGVAGRISTTAKTYYCVYIEQGTGKLVLIKWVNGVLTRLGSVSASSYGIGDHTLTLDMVGTTIRALIGGVEILNQTDSSITAAGKAGIRAPVISDWNIGKHLDNFVATDTSTPASPRSYVVGNIGL